MIFKKGYYWPDDIRDKDISFALNRIKRALAMVPYCKRHRVLIQAGGCIGIYPRIQSQHFQTVYTFEPDPDNYKVLLANLAYIPGEVLPMQACLGDKVDRVKYTKGHYSTGKISPGLGTTQWAIDKMLEFPGWDKDIYPDAIQLDIEGYEIKALQGAVQTIKKYSPVIQVELSPTNEEEVCAFLSKHKYRRRGGAPTDAVFTRE